MHTAEHKHCCGEIRWPGCRDYTPLGGNLRKGSAVESAVQPNQGLAVLWDTELQLLSIPLCHPLPLQCHIPLTGSALPDDNWASKFRIKKWMYGSHLTAHAWDLTNLTPGLLQRHPTLCPSHSDTLSRPLWTWPKQHTFLILWQVISHFLHFW